jgi:uncharacterized membrane protein YhaH (DUF805 family)
VVVAVASDDAGVATTPENERTARRRLVVGHVIAVLATAAYWFVLACIFAFVSWGNSVCGDATAHDVAAQRQATFGFTLLAAGAPAVAAIAFGRRRPRSAIAWLAVTVVVVAIGLVSSAHAQPSQWCLY